ncbi:ester cyclase [Streptomyces antimicrobicus]|uniref:Ester cyclase n=1 Tax=Streptomyces antimicrobicus TaxID=2883108 RepID=A0ABS8BB54_9ACTN|nr:ester cyclase [Streptomyces antimicrobicus]MCB5181865.1 ester cyclase [Streptomyces antimicrobicus]
MTFVQIIDYKTRRADDLNKLLDRYVEMSQGKRTVTHTVMCKDREAEDHYVEMVEFPSYEQAMRNSQLPETDRMFQEMVALCEGMPTFTNLDVVRDEHLNTLLANRMFDEIAVRGNLDAIDEVFASDYIDHDVMRGQDTARGRQAMRESCQGWRDAFDFSFKTDAQIAQDDHVTTVWTWTGRHKGEFLGIEPTGKTCTMSGTTTFRCENGEIAEGWWHYDAMSLMRQLGALE